MMFLKACPVFVLARLFFVPYAKQRKSRSHPIPILRARRSGSAAG